MFYAVDLAELDRSFSGRSVATGELVEYLDANARFLSNAAHTPAS